MRRVIDTFVAYGLPEPVFEATQGGMAVTVFNATVNEGANEGANKLLALISKQPGLRSPAMAEALQTSPKNIERWLQQHKKRFDRIQRRNQNWRIFFKDIKNIQMPRKTSTAHYQI